MASPDFNIQWGESGHHRVYVTPPGGNKLDVTFFRDVPTQIGSLSYSDPFGPAAAQITFPAITGFDRPGQGDLGWLVPYADVDVVFYDPDGSPIPGGSWEGFIVSEEYSEDGLSVQCKGALFQADNFLAEPTYPSLPIPYELLIKEALDPVTHPSLHTAPLKTVWPAGWSTVVPSFNQPAYLGFLRPWGVTTGEKWTGLTSRQTGSWNPILTGFVQSLLGMMVTEDGGQWTVMLDPGRVPVLRVRPLVRDASDDTLVVHFGVHGVSLSYSRDFTQSANVIYGQGTDLSGRGYSGAQVTRDGQTTFYEPFSALPQVWPAEAKNARYLPTMARKESMLQFPDGMDEMAAREVAAHQLRKFSDPGITAQLSLTSDPLRSDRVFSRMLIRPGMNILVKGLRSADVLFHIAEVNMSVFEGKVDLTLDNKFRDRLTISEVRARTRDALDPVRLLQVGRQSVTVNDLIKPWSYAEGSGCLPMGSKDFFTKIIPANERFPYQAWTVRYPPKKYPNQYVRVEPFNATREKNWSGISRDGIARAAIPIMMSQAGTIRLSQLAAYDINGNVLPVQFHLGIYSNSGISVMDMPISPASRTGQDPGNWPTNQRTPFFPGAFENIKRDGTEQDNPAVLLPNGADLVIGWGTYSEKAGHSPGRGSGGNPVTGLLVDEKSWTYDTTSDPGFDKYSTANTRKNPTAGMLYVMIYSEMQLTQPVFFMGRFFRQEPS